MKRFWMLSYTMIQDYPNERARPEDKWLAEQLPIVAQGDPISASDLADQLRGKAFVATRSTARSQASSK